jgi:hypothetical protein
MLPITTRQFNRAVQIQVWLGDAKLDTTALYTQVNMKIGQSSSLYLVYSERIQRRLQGCKAWNRVKPLGRRCYPQVRSRPRCRRA